MKIAFFLTSFPALSESFVLNQIIGLIDRGHEVGIFSMSSGGEKKVHPDVLKYGLLDKTVNLSPPINKVWRLLNSLYLIARNFHKAPHAITDSLNIFRHGKVAVSLRSLYMTIPFLHAGDYQIALCHFGPNGLFALRLREVGCIRSKIVTTFHGYDISEYITMNGEHVYDALFMKGDAFLPISENWKEQLIRLGCSTDKLIVHHMGVDCQKFEYRAAVFDGNLPIRILSIGRLAEKKGFEYGIRAVARLCSRYNIQYNIVGEGQLKSRLAATISELGAGENIRLLGEMDSEEVYKMLNTSHIFLCPSITDETGNKEGIPVVLMEAMATGLPVLSTWHSGIPELVEDTVSGFLVPERDIDALEEKLIYLIEQKDEWPALGKAGRERVEKCFDVNKLNDQLVKILESV